MTIDASVCVRQRPAMRRKLRLKYPGAIYHLMNRGDRREDIFKDDKNRERFLQTLGGGL
jgi:putative transposase